MNPTQRCIQVLARTHTLAGACLLATVVGCATTPPPPPASPTGTGAAARDTMLRPDIKDEAALNRRTAGEFAELGFSCTLNDSKSLLLCTHETLLNLGIDVKTDPPRLVSTIIFGFKPEMTCASVDPAINTYNAKFNLPKAYCRDGSLFVEDVFLLPETGFTRDELLVYYRWIKQALMLAFVKTGLDQQLK